MGDYWTIEKLFGEKEKKKDKKKNEKPEGKKKKDKEKKAEAVKYDKFIASDMHGVFEAVTKIGEKERTFYLIRTEDMKYPDVLFEGLSYKTFLYRLLDSERKESSEDLKLNKIMYSTMVTKIHVPKEFVKITAIMDSKCREKDQKDKKSSNNED
jgi:hypothetical protein